MRGLRSRRIYGTEKSLVSPVVSLRIGGVGFAHA
jgi:hypothetical protein